jgi:hypothetical protein
MMDEKTYDDYFRKYDDTEIIMPHPESKPLDGYLEYHNRNIFEKKHNRVKVVYEMTIDQLY